MATPRRKCRLADIDFRDEDLRKYKREIINSFHMSKRKGRCSCKSCLQG